MTYKDLAEYLQDLSHITKGAGREKVIQAAAILRSLDAQKPAAWWYPKGEQFALANGDDGSRPFAKVWEPLYAAPVAAQDSMPLSDSHPLAVFAQECAIGAHDYGGLRLAAQNALKAAHGIKERG